MNDAFNYGGSVRFASLTRDKPCGNLVVRTKQFEKWVTWYSYKGSEMYLSDTMGYDEEKRSMTPIASGGLQTGDHIVTSNDV